MPLKHNPSAPEIDPENDLKIIHEKGFLIAKRHLTPYLKELEKNHGYTQMEIAAALIILGYNAVLGAVKKNKMKALSVYSDLSRLSFFLLEDDKSKKDTFH